MLPSTSGPTPTNTDRKGLHEYTGPDRYNEWICDYLEVRLTEAQRQINRSVAEHERTQVIAANGIGKSWDAAALSLAFLFSNYPASVLATSGTYGKLQRTYCKPVEQLHRYTWGLPGEYKQAPPRIDFEDDPNIFLQATSPADAGELEGVHNKYVLGVVEEADKDAVDEEIIDSMESLLTDHRDRLLVISNPPRDEANIVAELQEDPTWNTLEFSSFASQPVRVELGEAEGPPIDNLVTLDRIKEDWESWNARPWPGVEEARASAENRELDERWYRRRMGVMPPATALANRPFEIASVREAFHREPQTVSATPQAVGMDVARSGGDYNAVAAVFEDELRILDFWTGKDHVEGEQKLRALYRGNWSCPLAIDAIGEGSALADNVSTWHDQTVRFNSGEVPGSPHEYKDCWSEGMHLLGEFLQNGGSIGNTRLREELLAAARVVEYTEKYISSRGTEVLSLSPKAEVKEVLERSPDLLDAAMQAVYAAEHGAGPRTVPSTW